jgi:hypothetical protein
MLASKVSVALTATPDIAVNLHVYNSDKISSLIVTFIYEAMFDNSDKISSLILTFIYEAMFDNDEVMKETIVQTRINCAIV